mmetsp:Transcript_15900/g.45714  ORF Transcript_15900/g.45714 Transcript_15900/m.45714 type:complete len:264 (-) Transcript_15900:149-940(-)
MIPDRLPRRVGIRRFGECRREGITGSSACFVLSNSFCRPWSLFLFLSCFYDKKTAGLVLVPLPASTPTALPSSSSASSSLSYSTSPPSATSHRATNLRSAQQKCPDIGGEHWASRTPFATSNRPHLARTRRRPPNFSGWSIGWKGRRRRNAWNRWSGDGACVPTDPARTIAVGCWRWDCWAYRRVVALGRDGGAFAEEGAEPTGRQAGVETDGHPLLMCVSVPVVEVTATATAATAPPDTYITCIRIRSVLRSSTNPRRPRGG